MMSFKIGTKTIGLGKPVFIIAEAGVNHDGRLNLALKLVDAAADAGADAVKFQTFKAEELVIPTTPMATYQEKNLGIKESQMAMLKKLEFREEHYPTVMKRCLERGIMFLSTPHGGMKSIDMLEKLRHLAYKIASGDLTNRPYLEYVARTKKPIILSTGMGTLQEIKDAVRWITSAGNSRIVVLQCTTNYPCPPEETNLRAMQTMMRALPVAIGYSDHTQGTQAGIMAVTLGACVVEKHFTLDRTMHGPDHAASLEPDELREFVHAIRAVETYMGSPTKTPTRSERKIMPIARKSIVTTRSILRGERITMKMIGFKRPGNGISPANYRKVIGKKAKRDIPPDHLLGASDYEA